MNYERNSARILSSISRLQLRILVLLGISVWTVTAPSAQAAERGGVLATILQSGSTNARGYKVTIYKDGSAMAEIGAAATALHSEPAQIQQFGTGTVQTGKLQALLTQIGDVSAIPTGHCMKSVSFGTRTEISYQGKTSGDLQCVRGTAGEQPENLLRASVELSRFVQNTLKQLKINNRRLPLDQAR
jgi:hypothetical protein